MSLFANVLSARLHTHYPFWQAPMPFDLITAKTSGQISAQGALGIIRIAAHDSVQSLNKNIADYKTYHEHPNFCFAHHLPHQQIAPSYTQESFFQLAENLSWYAQPPNLPTPNHFKDLLDVAIKANPRSIGFSNGIPDKSTIERIRDQGIFTFAICHNLPEMVTASSFEIDAIVVQGMEAGGERSYFDNALKHFPQPAFTLLQQARKHIDKPIVFWGDLTTAADMVAALISGASSLMLDRPWLACKENGLSDHLRNLAINGHEFNSVVNAYYTQHEMRYIETNNMPNNDFLENSLREGYFATLFTQSPNKRPVPVSLTSIDDPDTIKTFLTTLEAQLKEYIA